MKRLREDGFLLTAFRLAKELKMPIVKNVVALGGMAALFDLETSHLRGLINELWARKGAACAPATSAATSRATIPCDIKAS